MDALYSHLFRRNRRFAIPLHADPLSEHLNRRLTPDQLASIQSEMSVSAARASSSAAAAKQGAVTTTKNGGANAANVSTSIAPSVSTFTKAPTFAVGNPISSDAVTTTTTTRSSSFLLPTSTSTTTSSSSSTTTSSSLPTSSTTLLTRTLSNSSTTSPSSSPVPLPVISSDQSNTSSTSTGLSTGGLVGVVLAVLVGVVILGSLLGWLFKKFQRRGYGSGSKWDKLDDDITPFHNEKPDYADDIYGNNGSTGLVIGSRRALADYNRDQFGSGTSGMRPMSEYETNRAGLGSGHDIYQNNNNGVATYGQQDNGRNGIMPYSPYRDQYSPSELTSSRQLVGPGGNNLHGNYNDGPALTPVPMGRPAPPRSYSDVQAREDFDELPPPSSATYTVNRGYPNEKAGSMNWNHNNNSMDNDGGLISPMMPLPQYQPEATRGQSPSPPSVTNALPVQMPLPTLRPISPLSSSFDLIGSQPVGIHSQLQQQNSPPRTQKELYGEVAKAAGIIEPITPYSSKFNNQTLNSMSTAGGASELDRSYSTVSTTSSFSATEHGVIRRLPSLPSGASLQTQSREGKLPPVPVLNIERYEHGRPLSPLTELPTPSTMNAALPSSQLQHAQINRLSREPNPFENMPLPSTPSSSSSSSSLSRSLIAPHYALGGQGPMANFPPPSPGGVPGSVTGSPGYTSAESPSRNSPMRESRMIERRTRGESMFDENDAYGGI